MQTRSTQYEQLPGSREEHHLPNNDQHYTSYVDPQSRATADLKHPSDFPISQLSNGWSAGRIPENYESFQYNQDSDQHADAYKTSIQSFDCLDPKETVLTHSLRQNFRGSAIDRLSDWWWWELGSVFLSLSCIIAIIVTLLIMQDKSLSSWHSSIFPNALISVCNGDI
jgi:hypothetical protein